MACYHPNKGFIIGKKDNGKMDMMICKEDVICLAIEFKPPYGVHYHKVYKETFGLYQSYDKIYDYIEIPCGKCVGCRLDYARTWADRCELEMKYHKHSWFFTITYDDEHVPYQDAFKADTGEISPMQTLAKADLQKFWKRLRKASKQKIRYYACGEYGDTTLRPHYHAIVFGLDIPDLVPMSMSGDNVLYSSEYINSIWNNGMVAITEATRENCAYTARYVQKKAEKNINGICDKAGIEREFVVMSRRPGIAKQFYDDNKDSLYDLDYHVGHKGSKIYNPRYFEKLYENDYPEKLEEIKKKRIAEMKQIVYSEERGTSLNHYDYLKSKEINKKQKVSKLKRKEI